MGQMNDCVVCGHAVMAEPNVRSWTDRKGYVHLVHRMCERGPTMEQQMDSVLERLDALEETPNG